MRFVVPVAALLALWSMPVFGMNITASALDSPPTSNVEISQSTISSYSNPEGFPFEAIRKTLAGNVSAWRKVGQTFTVASSFTLDKITLMVSQSDQFPASGLQLYIDVYDAEGDVTAPNGTSLTGFPNTGAMPTIPVHSEVGLTADENIVWMTFDVANVELTPGIYGFRLGLDYSDFNGNYQLGSSGLDVGGIYLNRGGDPYDGGQMFRFHPSNGSVSSGFTDGLTDLAFILQSAAAQLGDFNSDGKVDAGDYATWRKNDLANTSLPNDDGLTTQAERYSLWRANFGNPPGSGSGIAGSASVPEPTTAMLVVAGIISGLVVRRRP